MEVVNTVGRRKAAVARVYVKPGKGQITINRKALEVYFPLEILQYQVKQPLLATNTAENYDIVINADKVKLTGKKMTDKVYTRHTGYPGGQRFATPADYLAKKPTFLIEKAVKGMLPKTRLGDKLLSNLKVYAGAEHPHAAQNPKTIKLNEIK